MTEKTEIQPIDEPIFHDAKQEAETKPEDVKGTVPPEREDDGLSEGVRRALAQREKQEAGAEEPSGLPMHVKVRGKTVIVNTRDPGAMNKIQLLALLAIGSAEVDAVLRDGGVMLELPTVDGGTWSLQRDVAVRVASLVPWVVASVSVVVAGVSLLLWWSGR